MHIAYCILQGVAERAGLVGEVLARAAPAYSGWDHRAVITIIQHLLKIIFLQMVMVGGSPGQLAALFTGQDAGIL